MKYLDRAENEARFRGAVEGIIRNSSLKQFINMWNKANALYGDDPNETDENIIYRDDEFMRVMTEKGYSFDEVRDLVGKAGGEYGAEYFTISDAPEIEFFGADKVMTEARIGALTDYVMYFERDCGEPLFKALLNCVNEGGNK